MQANRFFGSPNTHAVLFAVALLAASAAGAVTDPSDEGRNFDARLETQIAPTEPAQFQVEAVNALRAEVPDLLVTFDERSGATRSLWNAVGYLTGERQGEPTDLALDFLRDNLSLLGLESGDLEGFEVTDTVPSRVSGTTHLYLRQVHEGIPVYNGQLHVNVASGGRLLSVNNAFVPRLASSVSAPVPAIDAVEAVVRAADHLGVFLGAQPRVTERPSGVRQRTVLSSAELSLEPLTAELFWLPVADGDTRLVWNFQVYTLDEAHAYDINVDAGNGKIWTRYDWVASDSYQVYPLPVESPNHTTPLPPADARVIVNNPADLTASPFAWHDTNGVPGPEFTIMRGNNVHAYDDINNNGSPPAVEPNCGAGINCLFPINLAGQPNTYTAAAVANLFYWNNIVHDIQYHYGFDEASGNFQVNNYGNPGLGGDDVRAEAQDGGFINNANFLTPPDGSRPRMQMYLWNLTSPMRDGDLENSIIVHEYGHGISNRLVGGPSNVGCLNNLQQPGEGLSDWWSLAYTALPSHTGPTPRGIGTYVLGQPPTGPGIRVLPYSTDNTVNNWTYASVAGMSIPHGVGSVWAQGAWEVYWELVNQHGFNANLANPLGGAGNQRMMLYVNEGLKNSICRPAFTDVRDGIIQAAIANYNGEDVCRVWRAFGGFGLGTDAVSGGPGGLSPTNGFSIPGSCQLSPQTITATFNNSRASLAVCPAGTKVAGGGCIDFSVSTDTNAAQPLFTPIWGIEGFLCVQNAAVPQIDAQAICVNDPGTIGLVQVQQTTTTGTGVAVLCPAGKTVIGGGCSDDSFATSLLSSSFPLTTTTFGVEGWVCLYDTVSPTGLTAHATCIDTSQAAGIQVVQAQTSTATAVVAACPGQNVVLGGGCFDPTVTANLRPTFSLSPFGIESWACIWDIAATNLTAYSLCLAP